MYCKVSFICFSIVFFIRGVSIKRGFTKILYRGNGFVLFIRDCDSFCSFTDFDIDVLKLCEKNILRNCPHIEAADVVSNVSVRQLNWKDPTIDIRSIGDAGEFSWNDKDMELLKRASYIIAADGTVH